MTSFIGGYNLGALYATQWRDTHLGLRGPAAAELARAFIGFWNRFCPAHEQITQRYHHRFDALITISQNEALRASFPIRDMYIAAIDEAEQSILLTTAYFVPDHMLLNALKAAAGRGVDVRVLVPWESNHAVADWIAHSYFTECLQGGIRIFGYRYTMLHAKTCTIDGQWSTVGTCNLDRLSLVGNCQLPPVRHRRLEFTSGLHRNSAYLERRAALASRSDGSGMSDKHPVLPQSCQSKSVLMVTFLAPTRSACRV